MRKPDFFIAGAQKSGTSSLHYFLAQHDDFFMSSPKELHFFDRESFGKEELLAYCKNFDGVPEDKRCGESTPIYIFYPGAMERIRESLGEVKIIILLRDPVDRAYSHYWHTVRDGLEYKPFKEAIARESSDSEVYIRKHSYIERSCYSSQVARAERVFGRHNVKIVFFENLVARTLDTVNDVIAFLSPESVPMKEMAKEAKNVARLPKSTILHYFLSRINTSLPKRIIGKRVLALNLVEKKYPKLSSRDYDIVRKLILAKDPDILKFYPDFKCQRQDNLCPPEP